MHLFGLAFSDNKQSNKQNFIEKIYISGTIGITVKWKQTVLQLKTDM